MAHETWLRGLPNIERELGPLQSCELQGWRAMHRVATSGSGSSVDLTYLCKHEKYEAQVFFKVEVPSGGDAKILGQTVNSIGFLLE